MDYSIWDTSAVAPAEQFDLYRSGLCASFAKLTPNIQNKQEPFQAILDMWSDERQSLTRMRTQAHKVRRTRQDIVAAEDDHVYLNFLVSGRMAVSQEGNVRKMRANDLMIIDNGRLFEADIQTNSRHSHFAVQMTRSRGVERLLNEPHLLDRHPLSPLIRSQFSLIALSPVALQHHLVPSVLCTLNTIFTHLTDTLDDHTAYWQSNRTIAMVKHEISENFMNSDYSVERCAIQLGIPVRTLQHHISLHGSTFSSLLKGCRLTNARQEIETSVGIPGRPSIAQIATRHGYADLSTFHRAFKDFFGVTPGFFLRKVGSSQVQGPLISVEGRDSRFEN